MRYLTITIIALILASCSLSDDPSIGVVVSCNGIQADHYAPQRIHLTIDRTDPSLTFRWGSGHEIVVDHPYYLEISLVLCQGDSLTIGGECIIH